MGENFKKVTRQFQLISDMKILCFHTVFLFHFLEKKSWHIQNIMLLDRKCFNKSADRMILIYTQDILRDQDYVLCLISVEVFEIL